MAKAMPTLPPDGEKIAVFMPMTLPSSFEGRTAGIAAVHRRVDLQVVVIGAGADVAAMGRDDAGGHRTAEAERIADRKHPVADAGVLFAKLDIGELVAALTLSSATSVRGSAPTTLAGYFLPFSASPQCSRRYPPRGCW